MGLRELQTMLLQLLKSAQAALKHSFFRCAHQIPYFEAEEICKNLPLH